MTCHTTPCCACFHLLQNVNNQFTEVGRDPRCRFLGNVTLGKDVQLEELRRLYNAVRQGAG